MVATIPPVILFKPWPRLSAPILAVVQLTPNVSSCVIQFSQQMLAFEMCQSAIVLIHALQTLDFSLLGNQTGSFARGQFTGVNTISDKVALFGLQAIDPAATPAWSAWMMVTETMVVVDMAVLHAVAVVVAQSDGNETAIGAGIARGKQSTQDGGGENFCEFMRCHDQLLVKTAGLIALRAMSL
jgi:hypothetical protein